MTQQVINVGSAAGDGTGDPGRTAFQKVNANFAEIYGLSAGSALAFTSPSGTIDPSITGFTTATGRLKITLSADTSWEGLPAGADGQQLTVIIVSGNFTLTLLHLNGTTAQKQILASADFPFVLGDACQLIYDSTLAQWILLV